MSVRQLIVGGISVPHLAALELSQSYEELAARTVLRKRNGSAVLREAWSGKLRTTISGRGAIPAGLHGINYGAAVEISCIAHRALTQATRVFTLPAARRADTGSTPYGRALVGTTWVSTPVTIATHTATLDAVAGASQYQCVYFPKLSCFCSPPTEMRDPDGTLFGWELTAEEA